MSCHIASATPEDFFQFCESKKIKLSLKCKLLLDVFWSVKGFIDAESLWLLVKRKGKQISRSTVYKLLLRLHRDGFVVRKKADRANHKLFRLELVYFMSERPLYV